MSVGILFVRQLRLLGRGESYLETLRRQRQHWPPMPLGGGQQQQQAQQQQGQGQQQAQGQGQQQGMPPPVAGTEGGAMQNVRRVFGSGHPLTWLLPAWDVPPSVGSQRAKLS